MDKKAILKKAVKILLVLGLAGCLFLFLINLYMIRKEKPNIISADDAAALGDVDCIMVLGCSVRPDGTPSGMLRDRLDKGIELYEDGVSDRLLMSGDHGRKNYDEVNRMKQYAIDEGIPSGDIFMDHAGFSTYESMYRARDIFQVKKIIIVTQRYHMYRAGAGHGDGGIRRRVRSQAVRRPENEGLKRTAGQAQGFDLYHCNA